MKDKKTQKTFKEALAHVDILNRLRTKVCSRILCQDCIRFQDGCNGLETEMDQSEIRGVLTWAGDVKSISMEDNE